MRTHLNIDATDAPPSHPILSTVDTLPVVTLEIKFSEATKQDGQCSTAYHCDVFVQLVGQTCLYKFRSETRQQY